MAKRHWLDPLARQLLKAADRIGTPSPSGPSKRNGQAMGSVDSQARPRLSLAFGQDLGQRLGDVLAPRRAASQAWQLDVNRASAADWQRLPGCTVPQADLLLRLQRGGVQLSGLEDLQRLLNLDALTLELWRPMLVFRWYDAPAAGQGPALVALNQAGGQLLQEMLGLSPDRCRRLLRERGRGPFLDLADLQLRLQFPPQVIEAMIGKVEFTAAKPGPRLPDPRACIENGGPTAARVGEGAAGQRPTPQRSRAEHQIQGQQEGQRGPKLPLSKD
jgi:DNA uptake protein ComE-like DNA-binding protein